MRALLVLLCMFVLVACTPSADPPVESLVVGSQHWRHRPTPVASPVSTTTPSADCLGVQRYTEIRPTNTQWNNNAGVKPNPLYREWIEGFGPYYDKIDGLGCVGGTTEQILEWAALKWGLDKIPGSSKDLMKALAVQESDWYARIRGDYEECLQDWCYPSPGFYGLDYQTTGITAVKRTSWADSWPSSQNSTAFAADWTGAALKAYYDGAIPWAIGTKGNLTRTIGAWYCGCDDGGGDAYAASVLNSLSTREWEQSFFKDVSCYNCIP